MSYYTRKDLEQYLHSDLNYIAYVYPMGTGVGDQRMYYDEFEEVYFFGFTENCIIVQWKKEYEGKKWVEQALIPIKHIVSFKPIIGGRVTDF